MNWNVYTPVQKAYGYIAWHSKNILCTYEEDSDPEAQKQLPVMTVGISDHRSLDLACLIGCLIVWLLRQDLYCPRLSSDFLGKQS